MASSALPGSQVSSLEVTIVHKFALLDGIGRVRDILHRKGCETQFSNYQSLIQIQYQLCQSPMSKPEGGEDLMNRAVHNILK